jgi:hypothetical protein
MFCFCCLIEAVNAAFVKRLLDNGGTFQAGLGYVIGGCYFPAGSPVITTLGFVLPAGGQMRSIASSALALCSGGGLTRLRLPPLRRLRTRAPSPVRS